MRATKLAATNVEASIFPPVPREIAKSAQAIFGRSNFYLTVGDRVDELFKGLIQSDYSGREGKSGWVQAMLSLITLFQFLETLPDHRAVDAWRERLDWKYALHLPASYPCLEEYTLCTFRKSLLSEQAGEQVFQILIGRLSALHPQPGASLQGQPGRWVIARVCHFSRLAKIWETMNGALEALATWQPQWLLAASLPHWYVRYGHYRRPLNLDAESWEQVQFAQKVGADGFYLLDMVADSLQPEVEAQAEIAALRRVWAEQFECVDGTVIWRRQACSGCSLPWSLPGPYEGEDQAYIQEVDR